MLFVAPSPLVSGHGYRLAQIYPKLARDAKLNGLFTRRALEEHSTIGEYYGRPTKSVGAYTMQLRGGNLIEPPETCMARYTNFARAARDANAEFVQRGERVFFGRDARDPTDGGDPDTQTAPTACAPYPRHQSSVRAHRTGRGVREERGERAARQGAKTRCAREDARA